MQRLRFSSPFLAVFLAIAIVFFVLTAVRAEENDPELLKDRGAAPELNNSTWINTDKPLRLSELRGQQDPPHSGGTRVVSHTHTRDWRSR